MDNEPSAPADGTHNGALQQQVAAIPDGTVKNDS